ARLMAAEAALAASGAVGGGPGGAAGPDHFNIAFRDPLSGGPALVAQERARGQIDVNLAAGGSTEPAGGKLRLNTEHTASELTVYEHGADGSYPLAIVIAGADSGAGAADFAHSAGIPLLAEPSSGARFGREAIQHWQHL